MTALDMEMPYTKVAAIYTNSDMAHVYSIASLGGEYAGIGPRLSACDCNELLEVCTIKKTL